MEVIIYEKKKSGLRNEALDLMVYNQIMAKMQNPNWEKLKTNLDAKAIVIASAAKQSVTPDAITNTPDVIASGAKQSIVQKPKIKNHNSVTNW